MKNFDEPNAYVESFKVINPEDESLNVMKQDAQISLDAQFLPEGGNFIHSVKTNVGVIIKNSDGLGVSNIEGDIYDSDQKFVTSFQTNTLGIGRFQLTPNLKYNYVAKFNHLNHDYEFEIEDIKPKGVSIHVNNFSANLAVQLNTNESTLKDIKGKAFKLLIHNGSDSKGTLVTFKEKNILELVKFEELFPGVNILTLFDDNNRPVLERMFFNYKGVNFIESGTPSSTQLMDSTLIRIPLEKLDRDSIKNSNISISVLPAETKSYRRHHNIISQTYLQPYVESYIENAQYYFTDIDNKKKYDLDNLLITQGWSSYSWDNIFNNNVK
jgi:hypothetical protein